MIIGIDLRALQTGHKFRGIGEVTKQVTDRFLDRAANEHGQKIEIVFYEYSDDDPKQMLTLPPHLKYSTVKLGPMPEGTSVRSAKEKILANASLLYGNPIKDTGRCDAFLQFDYAFGVPMNTKTYLVKHDLIPYIFWNMYFESAWVPFRNKAARTTLRTLFANHKYTQTLRRSLKHAHRIIAVSQSTKNDVVDNFHINPKKIRVVHLGVDLKPAKTSQTVQSAMPTKPYLLFIGAGDARRRVDDLISAYNNLKAAGNDIQLVLVGENFPSPQNIPNLATRKAVLESSYASDILTVGYVDDTTKQELYKKAISFVYPTKYEGFGIPVLESMLLGCPVITYKNSSIPEVGGENVLYAHNWSDIMTCVTYLQNMTQAERERFVAAARDRASTFTWDKTAELIYASVLSGK